MIKNGIKRFSIKGDDAMKIRTVMTQGRIVKGLATLAVAWAMSLSPSTASATDLIHNSTDTASTKWAAQGGWGVTGGKYGKFDCSTCHEPNKKPNIKNIRRVITTQNGENWPGGGPSVTVAFSNVTSMGYDTGGHATSSRICEVCHSQNKFHNANTANNLANGGNLNHPSPKAVCTTCHKHNTGFKAACGGCHGNPPKEAVLGGDTGLIGTPRPSNALSSGQAGAHVTHTETRGMVCDTCHFINNGGTKMPNLSNTIDIGFFGFGGKVTSGTYVPYSSGDRGYRIASGTANTTIASVATTHTAANICSNVYCHGGGVKVGSTQIKAPLTGGVNQAPRWDAVSQNQCGNCHGTTPTNPPTMGSHVRHSGSTGYSFSCDLCHPTIDVTHVQGSVRWAFKTSDSRVGAAAGYKVAGSTTPTAMGATGEMAPSAAYGECSNLYCHSDGKNGQPRQNPTWGDSGYSTGCINCHGNNAGALSTITSNGHKAHVANTSARFTGFNFRCQECHNSTVGTTDTSLISTTLHVNRTANVNWGPDASYVPSGGTSTLQYNSAQTCTVYCHSNGKGKYKAPPQTWNSIGANQQGTIECNYCHNGLAGVQNQMSSGRHLNHTHNSPLPHRPIACNWCHSNTVAANGQSVYNGTDVKHINRTVDVTFIKMANFSGSYSTSSHVCSNTYCHTNNSNTGTRDWDTTAVNTCGNCHEANNSTTASATLSPAHRRHYNTSTRPASTTEDGWSTSIRSVSTNVFMCGVCHPGNPSTSHVSGPPAGVNNGSVAEVALRLPFTPPVDATRPETVTRGTGVNYDGRGYGYSTGTTCDTYCHSDGRGNPGKRNSSTVPRLEWTTSTGVVCGNCHNKYGDANPTWSGSHSKHLAGARSTNVTCNACHAATAADNTTLISARRDKHPNGFRNVTGNSIAGALRWDSSSQQCTNVYCHFYKPVTWGGSLSNGCASCHGYNAASTEPIATKGHTAHVNNTSPRFGGFNFKCNECHASTVNAFDNVTAVSLHANRVNNVTWGTKSSGGLAYTTNGCTQVYCHSNGAGTFRAPPTIWSNIAQGQQGTIQCNYCHNGLAGLQGQMSSGRHLNHISAGPLPHKPVTCNWCHTNTVAFNGQSVFNGTDVKHINRSIDVNFIKMANFSGSYASTHICSNTYCHGNNSTTTSRDWDTRTINTCGNCHEANNSTTATATLSPAHRKHYNRSTRPSSTTEEGWSNANLSSSTNVFMCGTCHPGSPTESHINGPPAGVTNGSVAEIILRPPFNNIPTGAGRPEVVFRGSGVVYDGRGYGYSLGTSCDTYCHSDGRGGLGKRNYANTTNLVQSPMTSVLRWTGRAAACGDCHNKASDNPASQFTTWSKPHNKHANTYGNGGTIGSYNTSTNNTLVTCAACHASTASSNTALVSNSRARHPNGYRNISASSTVGSASFRWDAGNNQCKNGYCHSRAYSFTDYSTPWIKWDTTQANITCGSCHGSYPTGPEYQNGYKGKANSHPKHAVFWGFTCDYCHYNTVGSGGNTVSTVRNHVNKNYNVAADGSKTFIGLPNTFTATATTNPPSVKTTCSNVNCHGANASKVFIWGGTNKCGDCHFATIDTTNYGFKNGTMAKISRTEWSWSGHGRQSGSYDVTGANFAGFSSAAATAGGAGDPCLYCHEYSSVNHGDTGNPMRLRNFNNATWGKNGVCLVCHASNGATGVTPGPGYTTRIATQRKVDKYHFGSKHSASLSGGQFCWDCHDAHGDRASATDGRPIAMIHKKPAMVSNAATGTPAFLTVTTVRFVAKATASDWAKAVAPYNGICNVCHTYKDADPSKLVHYTATSSDSHNSSTVCTQCHLHNTDTAYDGQAYTSDVKVCDGCHGGNNNGQLSVSATAGHALHYNQAGVFNNVTGSNRHSSTAYGYACKNCHPVNMHNEADGRADVLANINYSFGVSNLNDSKGYTYSSGGSCAQNSCHQDGKGGPAKTPSVSWNGVKTDNCGSCHNRAGDVNPTWSAAHTKHVNDYAANNTMNCNACHSTTTSSNTSIATGGFGNHADGIKTVVMNASSGGSYTASTFGCNNLSCHSTGKPTLTAADYVFVSWTTSSSRITCTTCHGGAGVNNKNNQPLSSAHAKHLAINTYGFNCASCHSKTMDLSNVALRQYTGVKYHVNGTRNVVMPVAYGGTASGASPAITCNNTYCHSNGKSAYRNPVWSTSTTSCVLCHPADAGQASAGDRIATGSHGLHVNNNTVLGSNYACAACHATTMAAGSSTTLNATTGYNNHIKNKQVDVSFGTYSGNKIGTTSITCSSTKCHGTTSPVWGADNTGNDACTKCHGTPTAGTIGSAADRYKAPASYGHQPHLGGGGSQLMAKVRCLECHKVPTNANTMGHIDTKGPAEVTFAFASSATKNGVTAYTYDPVYKTCANVYCHGAKMPKGDTGGTARLTVSWTDSSLLSGTNPPSSADCGTCHGNPPRFGLTSSAHRSVTTPTTSCGGCHSHITSNGTIGDPLLHINGRIDGGGGGGGCLSCHEIAASVTRAAITPQFRSQSHHVQGRAVTNADCYQCHMEASGTTGAPDTTFHGGQSKPGSAINLVVWSGSARGYVSYTANGRRSSIGKINDHCLSCHNATNSALAPFVAGSTTDKYSPEARLSAPKAKTSILSRYSSTRVIAWSQYKYSSASGSVARFGTNNKAYVTKALSAHGNAAKNQMMNWSTSRGEDSRPRDLVDYTYKGASKNRNVFCYDCHNSHGSTAAGVTSSYSSATGRYKGGLLKTTEAGKGGYTVNYTPAARTITYRNVSSLGQTTATNTSATFNPGASICNDCHNNDTRKININKPWSITGTYSSAKAIVGYWSTPYFDNYTVSSAKRTAYKAGGTVNAINDRRKPMGGHYGTSVANRSAAHSGEINGLCTPCHDPHGVSNALGTAGSGAAKAGKDFGVPLLKGTWVTSPYREDKADKTVVRGGGRNASNFGLKGAVPGYHIDQNTFMVTPAPSSTGAATSSGEGNQRKQAFRSFSNLSSAQTGTNMPNLSATTFAGLCLECHKQATLTNTTAPAASNWKTKERIHQSVSGWAATTGSNSGNKVHAYTCAKCHTPHVSRLPRLMVTNCLDVRHFGQVASGGSINSVASGTTTAGNIIQSTLTSTALGAGRFPGGGSRYSGTPSSAQNSGGWWFQTNGAAGTSQPSAASYGSSCHNATNAGGTTYSPTNQKWNNKTVW